MGGRPHLLVSSVLPLHVSAGCVLKQAAYSQVAMLCHSHAHLLAAALPICFTAWGLLHSLQSLTDCLVCAWAIAAGDPILATLEARRRTSWRSHSAGRRRWA